MKTISAEAKIEHAEKLARAVVAEQTALNVKIVADAVLDATKLIASANESAVKLIAANAAESAKVLLARGNDDHDLLVGLGKEFTIEMKGLKADIKELKDSFAVSIKDHGDRLTSLETTRTAFEAQVKTWILVAGLAYSIIAFLASKYL